MPNTIIEYLNQWAEQTPSETWLRAPQGDSVEEWTWAQAHEQIQALAAWQEENLEGPGAIAGIVSRNRPHWFFADLGSIAAGNVTVPMFTTLQKETAEHEMNFTGMQLLFVGETDNWDQIEPVLPAGITLVALPGVELPCEHLRWDDIVTPNLGKRASYQGKADDLITIVFTSGTTGMPKGVMQTHESNIVPIERFSYAFETPENARFISYLPLSHIAERQIVEYSSIVKRGNVTFNESLATLARDLQATRPMMMFGPPRVWEQLQQSVIAQFGSIEAFDAALAKDKQGVGAMVREKLGLDQSLYLLTAAAPTPPALIKWYSELGIELMEGFGQTEAMGIAANTSEARKIGSIGKPVKGVELKLSDQDELLVRCTGCTPGYYKQQDKTDELLQNGWLHTGDKARIDDEGFVFITGRVKDYFKTIQGKFVAPVAIENEFSQCLHIEQCCLLGRGYSKTVMVCVLTEEAQHLDRHAIELEFKSLAEQVNQNVDKHARVGAVILAKEEWTIENGMMTPTLKIKREQVEAKFGEQAEALALRSAQEREIFVAWAAS